MPHGVHRVMALVAVERPVAFLVGQKLDLPHLTDSDILGDFVLSCRCWRRSTIGAGHQKLVTMQMDRMIRHREVTDTNTDAIHMADHQRIDARKDPAVPRPDVEIEHGHDLWRGATRVDVERAQ